MEAPKIGGPVRPNTSNMPKAGPDIHTPSYTHKHTLSLSGL